MLSVNNEKVITTIDRRLFINYYTQGNHEISGILLFKRGIYGKIIGYPMLEIRLLSLLFKHRSKFIAVGIENKERTFVSINQIKMC